VINIKAAKELGLTLPQNAGRYRRRGESAVVGEDGVRAGSQNLPALKACRGPLSHETRRGRPHERDPQAECLFIQAI